MTLPWLSCIVFSTIPLIWTFAFSNFRSGPVTDMVVNWNKTKEIVMGPPSKTAHLWPLQLFAGHIEQVKSVKLLGINLDADILLTLLLLLLLELLLFSVVNIVPINVLQVLSRAFRNRFIELHFDEIPSDELVEILQKRCQLPQSYSQLLVKVMLELQVCVKDVCLWVLSSPSFPWIFSFTFMSMTLNSSSFIHPTFQALLPYKKLVKRLPSGCLQIFNSELL